MSDRGEDRESALVGTTAIEFVPLWRWLLGLLKSAEILGETPVARRGAKWPALSHQGGLEPHSQTLGPVCCRLLHYRAGSLPPAPLVVPGMTSIAQREAPVNTPISVGAGDRTQLPLFCWEARVQLYLWGSLLSFLWIFRPFSGGLPTGVTQRFSRVPFLTLLLELSSGGHSTRLSLAPTVPTCCTGACASGPRSKPESSPGPRWIPTRKVIQFSGSVCNHH